MTDSSCLHGAPYRLKNPITTMSGTRRQVPTAGQGRTNFNQAFGNAVTKAELEKRRLELVRMQRSLESELRNFQQQEARSVGTFHGADNDLRTSDFNTTDTEFDEINLARRTQSQSRILPQRAALAASAVRVSKMSPLIYNQHSSSKVVAHSNEMIAPDRKPVKEPFLPPPAAKKYQSEPRQALRNDLYERGEYQNRLAAAAMQAAAESEMTHLQEQETDLNTTLDTIAPSPEVNCTRHDYDEEILQACQQQTRSEPSSPQPLHSSPRPTTASSCPMNDDERAAREVYDDVLGRLQKPTRMQIEAHAKREEYSRVNLDLTLIDNEDMVLSQDQVAKLKERENRAARKKISKPKPLPPPIGQSLPFKKQTSPDRQEKPPKAPAISVPPEQDHPQPQPRQPRATKRPHEPPQHHVGQPSPMRESSQASKEARGQERIQATNLDPYLQKMFQKEVPLESAALTVEKQVVGNVARQGLAQVEAYREPPQTVKVAQPVVPVVPQPAPAASTIGKDDKTRNGEQKAYTPAHPDPTLPGGFEQNELIDEYPLHEIHCYSVIAQYDPVTAEQILRNREFAWGRTPWGFESTHVEPPAGDRTDEAWGQGPEPVFAELSPIPSPQDSVVGLGKPDFPARDHVADHNGTFAVDDSYQEFVQGVSRPAVESHRSVDTASAPAVFTKQVDKEADKQQEPLIAKPPLPPPLPWRQQPPPVQAQPPPTPSPPKTPPPQRPEPLIPTAFNGPIPSGLPYGDAHYVGPYRSPHRADTDSEKEVAHNAKILKGLTNHRPRGQLTTPPPTPPAIGQPVYQHRGQSQRDVIPRNPVPETPPPTPPPPPLPHPPRQSDPDQRDQHALAWRQNEEKLQAIIHAIRNLQLEIREMRNTGQTIDADTIDYIITQHDRNKKEMLAAARGELPSNIAELEDTAPISDSTLCRLDASEIAAMKTKCNHNSIQEFTGVANHYRSILAQISNMALTIELARTQKNPKWSMKAYRDKHMDEIDELKNLETMLEEQMRMISNRESGLYPTYNLPERFGQRDNLHDANLHRLVQNFHPKKEGHRIRATLDSIANLVETENLSRKGFKHMLRAACKGDAYEFVSQIIDQPLEDIICMLLQRYERHKTRQDHQRELDAFRRDPSESLLMAIAKLKSLVRALHPDKNPEELEVITYPLLKYHMKQYVDPTVWHQAEVAERKSIGAGTPFSFEDELQTQELATNKHWTPPHKPEASLNPMLARPTRSTSPYGRSASRSPTPPDFRRGGKIGKKIPTLAEQQRDRRQSPPAQRPNPPPTAPPNPTPAPQQHPTTTPRQESMPGNVGAQQPTSQPQQPPYQQQHSQPQHKTYQQQPQFQPQQQQFQQPQQYQPHLQPQRQQPPQQQQQQRPQTQNSRSNQQRQQNWGGFRGNRSQSVDRNRGQGFQQQGRPNNYGNRNFYQSPERIPRQYNDRPQYPSQEQNQLINTIRERPRALGYENQDPNSAYRDGGGGRGGYNNYDRGRGNFRGRSRNSKRGAKKTLQQNFSFNDHEMISQTLQIDLNKICWRDECRMNPESTPHFVGECSRNLY